MKLSTFNKLGLSFVGILILFGFLGFSALTNAQAPTPMPAPAPIPCSENRDPEFHSLRPYQASPCQTTATPTAKFCGNELTFHDTIPESYPGGKGDCVPNNNGKITCTYNEIITKSLTIDLSGAKLPIMGNTEDVPNSQPPTGSPLSDADKVNGYVSWYLNGTNNRAEYGGVPGNSDVVNYSGPLNKLLPSVILDAQRIKSINNARVTNHNQIVVCASSNWGILGDITGIGSFKPIPCYSAGLSEKNLRLSDWKTGGLSLVNTIANAIGNITPAMFRNLVGNQWNHKFPPLPWDDGTGNPFATEDLYTKAYYEWRGNTCITVPVINKTLCINNPLVSDKWADLYPYIPLSSTEDLMGQIKIDAVSSATSSTTGGVTVSGVGFSNQTPSTLFFPHMQESGDLAGTLQNTFVPKGQEQVGSPTNVALGTSCKSVEVRSNNGDKLFATQLTGNLTYTANFSCEFNPITTTTTTTNGKVCGIVGGTCVPSDWGCSTSHGSMDCGQGFQCGINCSSLVPVQTCTKDVYISLSTTGSIPLVDDIWSRLVAGPMAVFKRIFPKTNTPGSVGQIIDIPGSTNITYSGDGISQQNTDLKFPHIGGISEYFLKGIQTALRPKGYGEPISFDPSNPTTATTSGTIDCNQSAPESGFTKIMNKQELYQLALNWVSGKTSNHVLECYNDTVYRSKQAGVNIAMTLALWLHESDASNYSLGYVIDFGARYPTDPVGFSAQITEYLNRAKNSNIYFKSGAVCNNRSDIKDDFQAWATVYSTGKCDPTDPNAKEFYDEMMTTIAWVSDCSTPTSPIDTSCP